MAPTNSKNQDLFQDSTMSFSQHLDELRTCLIRAITCLAVGVTVGFFFGGWAVNFIQQPLVKSLETFYETQAHKKLVANSEELKKRGYSQMLIDMPKHGYLPEAVLILPSDARNLVRAANGEKLSDQTNQQQGHKISDVDNLNEYKGTGEDLISYFIIKRISDDNRTKTKALSAQEAFSIYLKASFVVGLLISSPGVFWYIWLFIAAGLYSHEKRYVYTFLPISLALFVGGMLIAFFVVFQFVLDFLLMFNAYLNIEPDPRISLWLNFALLLPIGFGLSFQLPVVMFFLERIGLCSIKLYVTKWRIAVFAICVIAVILTPGDPWSMLLMSLLLTILYFGGILMCKIFPRKKPFFDLSDENSLMV